MARYADRLLADGERVAMRGRQHVLATIIEGRVAWSILVASLIIVILDAFFLSATDDAGRLVRDAFGWIGLALLVIALVWLLKIYVEWYAEDYLITNRRVMKVEGVLKKRSADSSLEKINDAVLEQSVLGRMLGYGNLEILTAAEESVDRYRMLAQVQLFKRTMLDEKHKLEQEAFQIPAPPLRASVPMPPPAPEPAPSPAPAPDPATPVDAAPAPAEVAPAKAGMTSDEITTTLGNIADLRDRGAITPEEYEAKKQELLGRL
ncbi:MAG: hypothetical protein QOI92_1716 [Chloroflexota bacterium]|nr:hypothetical protein [Chloroflexota bacterium]